MILGLLVIALVPALLAAAPHAPGAGATAEPSHGGDPESVLMVGRYHNSYSKPVQPSHPDELFKIQYRATGIGVDRVLSAPHGVGGFTFDLGDTASGGTLEVLLPRNYPRSNIDNEQYGSFYTVMYYHADGFDTIEDFTKSSTECHYDYSIPIRPGDTFLTLFFPRHAVASHYVSEAVPDHCMQGNTVRYGVQEGVFYLPPKKQLELGIGRDSILCPLEQVLVFGRDKLPACASEATVEELIWRGWTHPMMTGAYLDGLKRWVWSVPGD